jgi:hypothetical protein
MAVTHIRTGGSNISACADGSFSFNDGLTSQMQCSRCPINSYCTNRIVNTCAIHSYSSSTGASSNAVCSADCDLPTAASLANGITAGNCSVGGNLHAGQDCLVSLQAGFTLTGGIFAH